ncbi:hypothetical protein D3C81_742860 [compost metagenome]
MGNLNRLVKKAEKTIKLMHGTSSTIIEKVFSDGLVPEGLTGNAMFNYNDYGRNGEPKHPECVYLTDDLEDALRYGANAVKHNNGFPVILEVEVSVDALTWDDDAFYKNYGDYDFGERDTQTGNWIRRSKKPLYEQSLEINRQCAHFGTIHPNKFKRIFLNGKWISTYDFIRIYNEHDKMKLKANEIKEKKNYYFRDFEIEIVDYAKMLLTIIDRNVFFYNINISQEFDKYQKQALSLKLMALAKENIKEFGAKIYYTPDLKSVGFNPKSSSLGYVFGRFQINNQEELVNQMKERIIRLDGDSEILDKIVSGKVSKEEFEGVFLYSVDFIGDLVEHCRDILGFSNDKIISVLQTVKQTYNEASDEAQAEIEYLMFRDKK